jgi:hypothetical protein
MAWNPKTAKAVPSISHGFQPFGGRQLLLAPPSTPTGISFVGLELFASIARANALVGATPSTIRALARSASQLICAVVEDPPRLFCVTKDVEYFADAKRTSFSGDIGAGIADLIMTRMGYLYRDNARTLLRTGKVGDFVYDGPPTGRTGVVLVEAKGRISATTTLATLQTTVRNGYVNQVLPHVGKTLNQIKILHGYAVGLGSQPGAVSSDIHIEETSYLPAVPSNPSFPPDFSAADARPPSSSFSATQVALGNYRALFGLLGADEVTTAIDAIRERQVSTFIDRRERIERYLRALTSPPTVDLVTLEPRSLLTEAPLLIRVGIVLQIAEAFLNQLLEILTNTREYLDLPTVQPAFSENGVVFPDGFFVNAVPVMPVGNPFSPLSQFGGGGVVSATPAALALRATAR